MTPLVNPHAWNSRGVAILCFNLCLGIAACTHLPTSAGGETALCEEARFVAAIGDAAVPKSSDIYDNLISITETEPRVTWRSEGKQRLLVVTWQSEEAVEKYFPPPGRVGMTSDSEAHVVWVTVVPQVQQFCRSLGLRGPQLSRRLKQHLGLNPCRSYDRFIELWVDPRDLFRPCPDPETNDTQCNLFWQEETPRVPRIRDYRAFFRSLYESSYKVDGAPWTRLGYTYDWSPGANKVGASEFILAPGSSYEVKATATADAYCQP